MQKQISKARRIRHNVVTVPLPFRNQILENAPPTYDILYKHPIITIIFMPNGLYKAYLHRGSLYLYIPTWLLESIAKHLGLDPVKAIYKGQIGIFFTDIRCNELGCTLRGVVDKWESH